LERDWVAAFAMMMITMTMKNRKNMPGKMKPEDPPTATDPSAAKKKMNTNSRMAATRIARRFWRLNG